MNKDHSIHSSLQMAGLNVTAPRLAVFRALLNGPASPRELAKLLPAVSQATIYRTLEVFQSQGITHYALPGGNVRFELSPRFGPHNHHLNCSGCGTTEPFHDSGLESALTRIARQHGFEERVHTIEVSGRCANCQAAA